MALGAENKERLHSATSSGKQHFRLSNWHWQKSRIFFFFDKIDTPMDTFTTINGLIALSLTVDAYTTASYATTPHPHSFLWVLIQFFMSWEQTQTRRVAAEFQKEWGSNHLLCSFCNRLSLKTMSQGFPGGSVIKNPPANAGDTGWILGLGRSHMPQSNKVCVPRLLCSRAREPPLLKPVCPGARAPQREKPLQWEARALQMESRLQSLQLEKSPHSNKDLVQPKIKKIIF